MPTEKNWVLTFNLDCGTCHTKYPVKFRWRSAQSSALSVSRRGAVRLPEVR